MEVIQRFAKSQQPADERGDSVPDGAEARAIGVELAEFAHDVLRPGIGGAGWRGEEQRQDESASAG